LIVTVYVLRVHRIKNEKPLQSNASPDIIGTD